MIDSALISKLNDLYVLNRWRYLRLSENGTYQTIIYYKNNNVEKSKKRKSSPLVDWNIIQHLRGEYTIGVFAGKLNGIESSKFLTFDIDVKEKLIAKWYVYKIGDALQNNGINDFYVSFSGNKGYHIDLFFNAPVPVKTLKRFFNYICTQAECINIDCGEVEFRPTLQQGVKIPLGHNFRNKESDNYCYFADYTKKLEMIKDSGYIYGIKKIDNILFQFQVDEWTETEDKQTVEHNKLDYEYIKGKYNPLPTYQENIDKDVTVEAIQKLESEGLKHTGMRHNSLFKLCKLYKYYGLEQSDNKDVLISWMEQQSKETYSSSWNDVLKDIDLIVKYVYDNDCSIVVAAKDISVSYQEMKQVLQAKSKNEKLLLFAMLVHSKRYASKTGIFYFAYSSIEKATGISDHTITKCLNSLSESKFIEIVSQNEDKIVNGKWIRKKANKYRSLIIPDAYINTSFIINKDTYNYKDVFDKCILNYFDDKDIKKYCGRRLSEQIINHRSA